MLHACKSLFNFILQVLPQSQVICHQSQYQMVYWCSAGLLHGLLMVYSFTTQSLWPTPKLVRWLCSPPPILTSFSPETTSQVWTHHHHHHHSVTSMCGVWLLSTQLVSVYLLTTPLQFHLYQVLYSLTIYVVSCMYIHVPVCVLHSSVRTYITCMCQLASFTSMFAVQFYLFFVL